MVISWGVMWMVKHVTTTHNMQWLSWGNGMFLIVLVMIDDSVNATDKFMNLYLSKIEKYTFNNNSNNNSRW